MKPRSSQKHPPEGQNKYEWPLLTRKQINKGKSTLKKEMNKQSTNTATTLPPPPACAHGIKKHIMHVYTQGQGTDANMQSQVQNFLATRKQFHVL